MFGAVFPILLALGAGFSLVVQQTVNASLRTALVSPIWSGLVSYVIGSICMLVFALATRDPFPSVTAAARLPWWAWTGGLFGAVFIALTIMLVPKLGSATFIALLIAGQMFTAIAFDHFGVLGLAQRSVDLPRLLGSLLLIGGVILIQR